MPYTFASQSGNLAHAFSLGVPAVVSGIEGLRAEAEASGAAITVPLGDKEELKRSILTLMKDESLRLKYKKRAISYVNKKISWTITAKKHLKVYKKAAARMKQGRDGLISEALL
jgi:glycosyltransferase involved in cell wall biosynthesis